MFWWTVDRFHHKMVLFEELIDECFALKFECKVGRDGNDWPC